MLSLSTQWRRLLLFAPRRKALALRANRHRISGQDRAFLQALAGRGESGKQCVTEVVTEGVVGAIFRPLDPFHIVPHPVAVQPRSVRPCPIGEMGDPPGPSGGERQPSHATTSKRGRLSRPLSLEGIAKTDIPLLETALEPAHPLV